jgi:hypothetical protein
MLKRQCLHPNEIPEDPPAPKERNEERALVFFMILAVFAFMSITAAIALDFGEMRGREQGERWGRSIAESRCHLDAPDWWLGSDEGRWGHGSY